MFVHKLKVEGGDQACHNLQDLFFGLMSAGADAMAATVRCPYLAEASNRVFRRLGLCGIRLWRIVLIMRIRLVLIGWIRISLGFIRWICSSLGLF